MGKGRGPSRHTEIEQKFDVTDTTVSPSFEGLASVGHTERLPNQTLEAVYFDTPGYDLAANLVTLRRRTGGSDAGWHLKLPAGKGARTEIHAPLESGSGADDAPEGLLDTVRAIVRDRRLVPVARIATDRAVTMVYGPDGTPLAEFCDDRVSTCSLDPDDGTPRNEQTWREWELELVDGALDGGAAVLTRLGQRLHDAGAAPASHGSKLAKTLGQVTPPRPRPTDPVHRAVAEQVALLVEWDRGVRADADDAVHQMRVTIRQIRSLLQASEADFGISDDASILSELRELAGVLGTARDAEVLADRYSAALDSLPPELVRGPVRERLAQGAWQRYHLGLNRALKAMRSQRYFRLLDALDELVADGAPVPETDQQPATISSSYRRVRKAQKKAAVAAREAETRAERDDALHRIRKAAKRLRYVAAATGDARIAERAKTVQTLLGEHQDSAVSRDHLLREASVAHAAGEDTFTYGLLYQQESELARECREQLDGALEQLRRSVRRAK
ncbi:MAG TPA: CYTH and CHAD domain-containing protein [Mycobacterium sp.]|nr:CYTH and CHAD domain-containing protein [Mycobacterium sp.]HQC75392.1 CYTH and CHAD domain-containing protein [Mycobacterium sp.]